KNRCHCDYLHDCDLDTDHAHDHEYDSKFEYDFDQHLENDHDNEFDQTLDHDHDLVINDPVYKIGVFIATISMTFSREPSPLGGGGIGAYSRGSVKLLVAPKSLGKPPL
ncbi:MAG TPA: hypothetical protein VMW32_02325, partial [Bacteroidales bacterium]|nr:hypothetical protein [Bacteroidales bacterium]